MLHKRAIRLGLLATFCFACIATPALAGSGGNLPWEAPLEQIQESITGPVAGYIALAAVAISGAMLIFGGELNDFARRLIYIVMVAGILLGATTIVGLFGSTGASVALLNSTSRIAKVAVLIGAGEGANG
ncbi:TrbC/VirB2 family protein [Rhizobium sp. G187]|uniref:TrbC/VirB2 family protein n=1 Tax=Rhizobium sp. G187 TaxID=3451352 RepID=UPI003EE472CB